MLRNHVVKLLVAMVFLASCATVTSETSTPKVLESGFYAGERYTLRQRQMEGRNGPFVQTSVVYRGVSSLCIIDSPGDCEIAARNLIDGYKSAFF